MAAKRQTGNTMTASDRATTRDTDMVPRTVLDEANVEHSREVGELLKRIRKLDAQREYLVDTLVDKRVQRFVNRRKGNFTSEEAEEVKEQYLTLLLADLQRVPASEGDK